jgi:hypothetical protein
MSGGRAIIGSTVHPPTSFLRRLRSHAMKAMNEFESVIVIAGLIIAVCATTDLQLAAPDAAVDRQGKGYSGSAMTQSIDLAWQASPDMAGNGAVPEPVSMTGPDAGSGLRQPPMPVLRSTRQARNSW